MAVVVASGCGIDSMLDAEQPELGIGRAFELFVGEDLRARRMIDREQLDLIEIRNLAQFLGHADLVTSVHFFQSAAPGIGHVLVVIHREVPSIAIARAQRSHAQNVRDELKLVAVPGPDHGAGTG